MKTDSLMTALTNYIDKRINEKYSNQAMTKAIYRYDDNDIVVGTSEDGLAIVFKNEDLIKMAIGVLDNKDGVATPLMVFGAGSGQGDNRGYFQKDADGISLYYVGDLSEGEVSYLKLMKDKAVLNGYEVFSTASSIGDSYLASAADWNNKTQNLNTSGDAVNMTYTYTKDTYDIVIGTSTDGIAILYKESDTTKMAIGVLRNKDNVGTPLMVFGAGDGYGSNRGYIQKDADGLSMYYIGSIGAGEVSYIKLMKDKAVINGYEIFSTASSIGDSYLASAADWNNKTQNLNSSGDATDMTFTHTKNTYDIVIGTSTDGVSILYKESSVTKMAIGILRDKNNTGIPLMVFGASSGYGDNRGYIQKDTDGLSMYYIGDLSEGEVSYIKLMKDKAVINGYEIFSTSSSIGDSYLASASDWNNKTQKLNTSGNATSMNIYTSASGARVELLNTDILQVVNSDGQKHGAYAITSEWGDFAIYYDNTAYFGIYNGQDYFDLRGHGSTFLRYSDGNDTCAPQGDWDFDDATVTNLTATAAFG